VKPVRGRRLLADAVRDEVRQAIMSGELRPGERLPSEQELTETFRVSRVTIREAIRGLVEEGFLSRQQGVGTYVTDRPRLRNTLDRNFSVTQLIEGLGRRPGNQAVSVERLAAPADVAERLALALGEEILRLERVRTADGDPVVYSVEYLESRLLPDDAELGRLSRSLYQLLADQGRHVHHAVATILPAIADEILAKKLGVQRGAPLLHLVQVDYGADERPLVYSLEWYDAAAIDFTVYRRGPA